MIRSLLQQNAESDIDVVGEVLAARKMEARASVTISVTVTQCRPIAKGYCETFSDIKLGIDRLATLETQSQVA